MTVSVSASADDCIICLGEEVTFTDLSNSWATTTTWSITPGGSNNWMFTDTSMTVDSDVITIDFLQAGTYTIRLTADNPCQGVDEWVKEIEVLDKNGTWQRTLHSSFPPCSEVVPFMWAFRIKCSPIGDFD